MRTLLLGAHGQVGWELQRSLAPLGTMLTMGQRGLNHVVADLGDPRDLTNKVKRIKPEIIVNAAAYTSVDEAESEPAMAYAVNSRAPEILAEEARQSGALLVHYSTDYVFDGSGVDPWSETDATNPLNIYGRTKLEGERKIRERDCHHLIFRTSWIYSATGHNFIKTILKLGTEREELKVVNDQIGSPTSAELIADVTAQAIPIALRDNSVAGTYHLAADEETSWWDYAVLILDFAIKAGAPVKVVPEHIQAVSSQKFFTAARRPLNSRLNTTKLQKTFGFYLPPWDEGVLRALREIFPHKR